MPQPLSYRLQRGLRLAESFGTFAARADDLQTLLDEACRVAALGLGAAFVKLLVYEPGERVFLVRAGLGWRDGIVGKARLDADIGTAAGFAWHTGQPIISNDLVTEGRFRLPDILAEHGILRSINVVIGGEREVAFGVLEVESPDAGEFTTVDLSFLQIVAHSLAATIDRIARPESRDDDMSRDIQDHRTSMRELQHRVRNDLQVIHSLVSNEARRSVDSSLRAGLGRVGRRILALAALYDQLLGGNRDDAVDMGAYLLLLCEKIAEAADLPSRGIELRADTQPLMLPLQRAVRLGTAVNELVANASEHAFPGDRPGKITVRLLARGEAGAGHPLVTVCDDGCGFTGSRVGGHGLRLAEQLAHQAAALLTRGDGPGTGWRLELAP